MKDGECSTAAIHQPAEVLTQLSGLWDGAAASSGLWLMMSLGLSRYLSAHGSKSRRTCGEGATIEQYFVTVARHNTDLCKYSDICLRLMYRFDPVSFFCNCIKQSNIQSIPQCFMLMCCSVKLFDWNSLLCCLWMSN